MRSPRQVLLVLCLIPALCVAQNPTNGGPVYPESDKSQSAPVQAAPSDATSTAPPPAPAAPAPVKHSPEGFPILEDGTPVRLSLARSLSSAECRVGDRVDFKVVDPIVLDGVPVVPRGAIAWGKVAEAKKKRRMGRGGKLGIEIDSVQLANSNRVRLRAVRQATGGGHTALMSGAMVGTAIVFLPIAPVWLLMHGKEAKIPEGTEITAYVNGDFTYPVHPAEAPANTATAAPAAASSTATAPPAPMPPAEKAAQPAEAAPEPAAPDSSYGSDAALEAAPVSTEIAFTSSPDGAEIELDGRFMGNTPSTIGLPGGEHTVRISKRGYRTYEKRVHTSGGSIRLHADLEAER
jgi:PEGA domain-containing protein